MTDAEVMARVKYLLEAGYPPDAAWQIALKEAGKA